MEIINMRKVAVIPVKNTSDRVANKNFKEFSNGISLLELKIMQLIESECFDRIYISTNSASAHQIAKKYDEVQIIEREDKYCNNVINWSEVITEVANSIPEDEGTAIAWCHATSPLFSNFKECLKLFEENLKNGSYNGLVTVTSLNEFIVNQAVRPVNYSWGVWHQYSQNLEKLYSITGSLFIAEKSEMIKNKYVISTSPLLFEVSPYEAIDIDTEYDFELAKLLFMNKNLFSNLD